MPSRTLRTVCPSATRFAVLAALTALVALAGCDPAAGGGDATIVATIHPVASIVGSIAGPAAEVRTLVPPGANPDTYEPTPRVVEAAEGAVLVVRVGGPIDGWLGSPGPRDLVLTEGLELRQAGHGEGTGNPHVWLDPLLVRDDLLPRVRDALIEALPEAEPGIRSRAAAYADSLTVLDREIRDLLEDAPRRRFVSAHGAWVYFAERYGLEEVGVLHPSPAEEIGTRELARLVERARELGVTAVIAEPQLGRGGVEALAGELRVRAEVADPIGGPGLDERDDYLSLMRFNARAFARALGGDA